MSLTEQEITDIVARVVAELGPPVVSPLAARDDHFQVAPGQTILADHMNSALNQGVPKFANAAARDAGWPAPPIGAMCYRRDTQYFEVYDNGIAGGAAKWHVLGTLRMGYASMGISQAIPNGSVDTLIRLGVAAGAANQVGRASWASDGSVTVPLDGTYLVTADICWPANSSGERRSYIKKYSAGAWSFSMVAGGVSEINTGAVGSTLLRQQSAAMVYCLAGEKIGYFAQHSSSASNLTLAANGPDAASMAILYLGAD